MYILQEIEDEGQYLKLIEMEKKDRDYFKESQIQNMIVEWLESQGIDFHPSFSGIKATFGQRRFMKSQGMKAGHPDLTVEHKNNKHEVLFLEIKTVKGVLSREQEHWIKKKIEDGYAVSVGWGYYDCIYKIFKYMNNEPVYYEKKN